MASELFDCAHCNRRRFLGGSLAATGLLLPATAAAAVLDGPAAKQASFYNTHTGESLTALYWERGHYVPAGLTEIGTPIASDTGGAGVLVTKKLAYVVGFEDGLLQPLDIEKKGALAPTGSTFISPIPLDAFTSDKSGKRMVLTGYTGIVTATIADKKTGQPGQLDLAPFLAETNPNAAVLLDR